MCDYRALNLMLREPRSPADAILKRRSQEVGWFVRVTVDEHLDLMRAGEGSDVSVRQGVTPAGRNLQVHPDLAGKGSFLLGEHAGVSEDIDEARFDGGSVRTRWDGFDGSLTMNNDNLRSRLSGEGGCFMDRLGGYVGEFHPDDDANRPVSLDDHAIGSEGVEQLADSADSRVVSQTNRAVPVDNSSPDLLHRGEHAIRVERVGVKVDNARLVRVTHLACPTLVVPRRC